MDIDEEQKERHLLSKRKVIPLPTKRACPETNPDALYRPGTTILAIYPQTTCFYKGVIKFQPATGIFVARCVPLTYSKANQIYDLSFQGLKTIRFCSRIRHTPTVTHLLCKWPKDTLFLYLTRKVESSTLIKR